MSRDTRCHETTYSMTGLVPTMIVCSCNVLSDHDIRAAMNSADELPRTAHQVYGCLGCRVKCGRCVGTIRKIMDHASGGCDKECGSGLPPGVAHTTANPDHIVVAL